MTFVANLSGRKKILWGQLLKISLLLLPISTGTTTLAYILLAQRWNPLAAWLGLAGGAITVVLILMVNFATPIFRLPHIRAK